MTDLSKLTIIERSAADQVGRDADYRGPRGRAWLVDHAKMLVRDGATVDEDATIGLWVVEASWAHPFWHSYAIALVHLRPIQGGTPAKISREGATHEFWVWALDPDIPRGPFIAGDCTKTPYLWPINFGAQIVCTDDQNAKEVIERAVVDIIEGRLNPDTDARSQWKARFGDSLFKKEFR